MSTCPNCQQQIPEISEGKFCPFCGTTLSTETVVPLSSPPSVPSLEGEPESPPGWQAGPAPAAPVNEVPWENRQRLGFLPAFSQTWSDSVFHPVEFFRRVPKTGNVGSALLYSCLIGITGSLLSLFWSYWFWESSPNMERVQELFGAAFNRETLGYIALLVPFMTIIGIFLAACIFHLCLMLTGSNKHGFETTLRAYCYSCGPHLLAVIPQCGGFIAFIWQIVLMVVAWREMHESTTGRVVIAVLLPFIFCCGLIMLFAMSLVGLISRVSH